jgi:hypothetical protein
VSWTRFRLAALAIPGCLCLIVLFTPLMDSRLGEGNAGVPLPQGIDRWPPAAVLAVLAVLAGRKAQRMPSTMRRLATTVSVLNYASVVILAVLTAGVVLLVPR